MTWYRKLAVGALTAAVFGLVAFQGLRMAEHKSMWDDEVYSLKSTLGLSWCDIWLGRMPESNNSPLFYSFQKVILNAACQSRESCLAKPWWRDILMERESGKPLSLAQRSGETILDYAGGASLWDLGQINSLLRCQLRAQVLFRVIVRFLPLLFTALGLAVLVWYFARFYSFAAAFFALGSILASETLWPFWADARPYGMVVTFSLFQALALFHAFRRNKMGAVWGWIGLSHLLLALTSTISVLQILAAGGCLFLAGQRRIWPLLWAVVLPAVIACFYFGVGLRMPFYFTSFGQVLRFWNMNLPWYWMITLIGASVLMLRSHWGEVKLFMSWVAGVIGLYAGMTLWLLLKNHPGVGACAVGRYYLVLMPVGVVALSAFVVEAWRRMTSWKMRSLVVLIALAVLLPGLVRAAGWLLQGAWPEYLRS